MKDLEKLSKTELIAEIKELRKAQQSMAKNATEKRDSEIKLAIIYERLTKTMANISDGFVSLDTNWNYTYVNKRAAEIFGRKPEELIGKHIWTEFPEGIDQPFYKNYHKAVETRQTIRFEEYYPPWSLWFENRIIPSEDGLAIFFQDNTKRKLAEIELVKAKEIAETSMKYLDNIINNVADPVFVKDDQSRLLLVNDAFCSIFDLSREQIIGKTLAEDVPETEREGFSRIDNQVLSDGIENIKEESLTVRGGKTKTISTKKTRYIDKDGKKFLVGIIHDITEQKETQDELKEGLIRERLMADIVRKSVVGIAIGYPDGRLGMCNSAFQSMTKYSEEELKSIDWNTVLTPPEWHESESAKLQELHKTKKSVQYEKEYIRKDGSRVPIELMVNPKFDDKGAIEYYFAFIIDITERKQSEEKLFESIEQLNLALKGANAGLWSWNIKTGEDLLDERWCAILGYTKDEVKQHVSTWEALIHPDDKNRITNVIQKHFENENNEYREEYRMKCKNGEWKWVFAAGKIVKRNAEGEPAQMTGIIIDIAERKLAEEKIHTAEENLKNTFDISPSIISKANISKGYFVKVNQAVTKILGYTIEEFTSIPFMKLIHPDDRHEAIDEISEQLTGKEVNFFENRYLCKDGSYKWMAWHGTNADKNGIVTAIGTDIHERKLAEQELKKHQENLVELVKERTKTLEEKNDELERFNELFIDREFRIKELKDEIKELEQQKDEQ